MSFSSCFLVLAPSPSVLPKSRRGDFALRAFGHHRTPAFSPWGWAETCHLKLQPATFLPSDALSALSEEGGERK